MHYEWTKVFDADGKLRSKEELKADFAALGIDENTEVIPNCQSGVRSSFIYAVFKWLGFKTAKNYDGSWWEWSREVPADEEPGDDTNDDVTEQ